MKQSSLSSSPLAPVRLLAALILTLGLLTGAGCTSQNPVGQGAGVGQSDAGDNGPDADDPEDEPDDQDDAGQPDAEDPNNDAPDADDPQDADEPTDADEPDAEPDADTPDAEDDADDPDGGDAEDEPGDEEVLRILAVSPDRGSVEGGTDVEITVLGQLQDPVVQFDGRLSPEVEVLSNHSLRAVTPPGFAGPADVKVVDGALSDTLVESFFYIAPMRLDGVTPDSGSADGGDIVELRGAAFGPEVQVSFGGRAAVQVDRISDEVLLAVTPPGVAGAVDVRVTDPYTSALRPRGYTYFDPVEVRALFPAAGPRVGGQVVVLTGRGLTPDARVRFGGIPAASVRIISDERAEVVTPPGPLGPVDVEIITAFGTGGLPGGYTYFDAGQAQGVRLLAVQPDEGAARGGDEVILSGTGFDNDDLEVTFGDAPAQLVELTDRALRVRTPAGPVGPATVRVSNAAGADQRVEGYTYLTNLAVEAVTPDTGPVAGGTAVEIRGTGFDARTRFTVGPLELRDVVVESPTMARGVTPPGSLGLNAVVAIAPRQRASLPDAFLYTAPAAVTSVAPTRGSIAGGTILTVRGRGFLPGAAVTLDGAECLEVRVIDQATLSCVTPPHREGAVTVRVVQNQESLASPNRYIFFNPASRFGGVWGDRIAGAVNVSVFSVGGEAVEGAFVMLTVDGDTDHQGFTNEQGLITFSGEDVSGNQFVSATAAGHSSATVQAVNAENITILLVPTVPPSGGGGGGGLPLATITGQVGGFQKIAEPGPGQRQIIIVETTRSSVGRPNPWPGNGNIVDPNGDRTYTLISRVGDLAVVAWGGLVNDRTGEFTPYAIGIRRYLFTSQDETYEVDLELDITLNNPLTFKLNGAALDPDAGPNINRVIPWVDLGFEGVFGSYDVAEGTGDIIVAEHQPPLTGALSDASFYVYGGAWTNNGSPYSLSVIPELRQTQGLIEMPTLVAVPRPLVPEDGGLAEDGYVAFDPSTNHLPDFWHIQLYQLPATLVWEVTVPGEQTWFHLPRFPDFSQLPPELRPTPYANNSSLYMIVNGARIEGFDFDQHEYLTDLRSRDRWRSWTRAAWFLSIE